MGMPPVARWTALVLAALPALAVRPALAAAAQQTGGRINWQAIGLTLAAVAVALILLAVGYFYRRAAGIDKPPPVTILEPGRRITED
jgi:hypothetical protein